MSGRERDLQNEALVREAVGVVPMDCPYFGRVQTLYLHWEASRFFWPPDVRFLRAVVGEFNAPRVDLLGPWEVPELD